MVSVTQGPRSPPLLWPSTTTILHILQPSTTTILHTRLGRAPAGIRGRARVQCSASIPTSSMRSADHCITASSRLINTKISSSGIVTSLTLARVQELRRTFWSIQLTLETTRTSLSLLIIMVMEPFLIQYLTHTFYKFQTITLVGRLISIRLPLSLVQQSITRVGWFREVTCSSTKTPDSHADPSSMI